MNPLLINFIMSIGALARQEINTHWSEIEVLIEIMGRLHSSNQLTEDKVLQMTVFVDRLAVINKKLTEAEIAALCESAEGPIDRTYIPTRTGAN